jgi:hypothetical protein
VCTHAAFLTVLEERILRQLQRLPHTAASSATLSCHRLAPSLAAVTRSLGAAAAAAAAESDWVRNYRLDGGDYLLHGCQNLVTDSSKHRAGDAPSAPNTDASAAHTGGHSTGKPAATKNLCNATIPLMAQVQNCRCIRSFSPVCCRGLHVYI